MGDRAGRLEGWIALVLGGTGLIGSHAVRALAERGAAVRVLVRPTSRRDVLDDVPGIEWVEGDLHSRRSLASALGGCHLLVHAAAPYPTRAFGRERELERAAATIRNVLETAREHLSPEIPWGPLGDLTIPPGLARIVYVSSSTTIAPAPPGQQEQAPREEERPAGSPDGAPYFAVKEMMEEEARAAARKRDLPVVIVNPSLVIGPHDTKPTTGQLVVAVARRRMPFLLRGQVNVVAARDVGEGIVLAALRGRPGERYVLGGENMSLDDLVRRIAMATGVPAPSRHIPHALAGIVSWMTEVVACFTPGQPPLLPLNGLRMLERSRPLDSSRAISELGWRPTPVDDAILRAVEWLRSEGRF